jgi:hypothetical protein
MDLEAGGELMMFLGMFLGITVAGAAGWLLGSWLAFAIGLVPLVVLGALFGWLHDMYSYQRRIIETPELIDVRAQELMSAGQWREASQWLLHAANLVEQAAKEGRPDREAILALAARWQALARTCVQRYVGADYELFRAFRALREGERKRKRKRKRA